MSKINEMRLGFETAYIDGSVVSSSTYRPQFVSNNHKEGKKVLSSIEDELLSCDGFQISVAFITMSGITPLLQTLKELEKRNIKGEILTTNYLNFSEPRALKKLDELSNITLKMYDVEMAAEGFHTKGYIFKTDEIYRIIIGSSNITSAALTSNREWNTRLISTEQGEVAKEIVAEFNELWNSKYTIKSNEDKVYAKRIDKAEYAKEAEAAYQQINDLIRRFQLIDAAIVESNTKTEVNTSYGTFTVAGAISLRSRLRGIDAYDGEADFEGKLKNKLNHEYSERVQFCDMKNGQLQSTAESMRLSILGRDAKAKDDKPLGVVDAYMKENTTELVDPLDVKKKVDMLEEKRNILLTELDTQIKVSNATTFIEIA